MPLVAGVGLLGIVGLGAVGGILANIALTPLTAGASLLQSYWYGSGLILGERMMYTVHWEKIKGRLDKGEDFLQVLDKIMNDDITAIANLSFKAMDETGKLYLDKAGTSIADLVERLLSAILGNPVEVTVVPAPPGETTPTGIVLTISQIQNMSTNTLLFETQPNQITKYSQATQQHMKTELASRGSTTKIQEQEESNIEKLNKALLDLQNVTNEELDKLIAGAPDVKIRATGVQIAERKRIIRKLHEASQAMKKQHDKMVLLSGEQRKIALKERNRLLAIQQKLAKALTTLLIYYKFPTEN